MIIRKTYMTIALLLTMICTSYGQGWERIYDEFFYLPNSEEYIYTKSNDHYIWIGSRRITQPSAREVIVMEVDPVGDMTWYKTYPIDQSLLGTTLCNDDGVAYTFGSSGTTSSIVKLDANGDLEWSKNYMDETAGSLIQTSDGGFMLVKRSNRFSSNIVYSIELTRLDASGNTLWTNDYSGVENERGLGVVELANGDFVIAGRKLPTSNTQLILVR
ncbi:MAG: hypothetical protein AAGD05_19490, partial [Bacteroidota bacterium]